MSKTTAIYTLIAILTSGIIISIAILFGVRENNPLPMVPLEGVQKAVAQELIYPESAKFRNMIIVHDTYCGEVNSKDKFGEYVGFKNFMVRKTESKKFELVVSFLDEHIEIFCR